MKNKTKDKTRTYKNMCCGDRYNIHVVQRVIGTDFPLKLLQHLINLDKAEQRVHPTQPTPNPSLPSALRLPFFLPSPAARRRWVEKFARGAVRWTLLYFIWGTATARGSGKIILIKKRRKVRLSRECRGISNSTATSAAANYCNYIYVHIYIYKLMRFIRHHWCGQISGKFGSVGGQRARARTVGGCFEFVGPGEEAQREADSERAREEEEGETRKEKKSRPSESEKESRSEWITTNPRKKTSRVNSPTTRRRYVCEPEVLERLSVILWVAPWPVMTSLIKTESC